MENRSLEELLKIQYSVAIFCINDNGDLYFMAFHPDFGASTCSATGDTEKEALEALKTVRKVVIQHFFETGNNIPEPSLSPFETDND